jgi:integral membrane protein
MPLKYLAGHPEAVRVVGSLHGGLFVIYVLMVFLAARRFSWKPATVLLALAAAVFPFGPFWFDAKLRNGTLR